MPRPKIVLTCASTQRTSGLQRLDSVTGVNYSEAVALAGGLPFMVANLDPGLAPVYAAAADAVLFSGGVDVEPSHFGQEPQPGLGQVSIERDRFELALYSAARERGLPVLGICRGIQLINVAQGGTLHQHVPALPQVLQHEQADIRGHPIHTVRLDPKARLAEALGMSELKTNSFHHQVIDELGDGLRAVGWTADGLVEVLEEAHGSFILAVQWHPEMSFSERDEHAKPFELLVEAAWQARSRTSPAAAVDR